MQIDWFTQFGLYVARDFFDVELCARLREEASAAAGVQATVRKTGAEYAVDESRRRTKIADVSSASLALVTERLRAIQPQLERHFEVETRGCRQPQFLVYREGDFFRPHADVSHEADAPAMATGRQISVVVFLNDETAEPGPEGYCGGALEFYGLLDNPLLRERGLPLNGARGALVAFRPEIVHGVSPVTHGERHTVVTWFEA
ncbi:MAG: 2OG-Fe(II) oxygenase [Candidatus Binatia bacterium]